MSDVTERNDDIDFIVVEDPSTFYRVSSQWKNRLNVTTIQRFRNLQKNYEGELQSTMNGQDLNLLNVVFWKNQFISFTVIENDAGAEVFYQEYDTLCRPISEPKQLISFLLSPSQDLGQLSFEISENLEFGAAFLTFVDADTKLNHFSYVVFDNNLTVVRKGNLTAERTKDDSSFSAWRIENDGSVFVTENTLLPKLKIERQNNRRMDYQTIHHVGNTVRSLRLIPKPNTFLSEVYCSLNENGMLVGTGIYCNDNDHFRGWFSFEQKDVDDSEISVVCWDRTAFPEMTEFNLGYTKKRKPNKEFIKAYACNHITLLSMYNTPNETRTYVWERNYYMVNKSSVTYVSKDILIMKWHLDSIVDCKVIPKMQFSYNDNAQNLSSKVILDENRILIFFNDCAQNYDASGTYLGTVAESLEFPSLRDVDLVCATYTIETGNVSQRVIFNRTVFDLASAPVFWRKSGTNTLLLVFANRKIERFAYWQY